MLLQMVLFHYFLWLAFHCVYHCIFFIHSSVDKHSACIHILTIVNSASMNTGCVYLFELEFCPDIYLGVGLLDYMETLFLVF